MMSGPAVFPEELVAQEPVEIPLERGKTVAVRSFRVLFNAAPERSGLGLDRAWSAKSLVLQEKQAMFPEIACLSLFQRSGWHGVWSDLPHRKYFDKMPTQSKGTSLDTFAQQQVSRIAETNQQSRAGCWDIILWENRTVVFVQVSAADAALAVLSPARVRWLEASLRCGLSPQQFAIVTWAYRTVAARRRQKHAS